jgi:hypothetical protein
MLETMDIDLNRVQVYRDVVLYLSEDGYVRWRKTTQKDLNAERYNPWWKIW